MLLDRENIIYLSINYHLLDHQEPGNAENNHHSRKRE